MFTSLRDDLIRAEGGRGGALGCAGKGSREGDFSGCVLKSLGGLSRPDADLGGGFRLAFARSMASMTAGPIQSFWTDELLKEEIAGGLFPFHLAFEAPDFHGYRA